MQKLKCGLMIAIVSLSFSAMAETVVISSISDGLILSAKESNVQIELPYIYVPKDFNASAQEKLKTLALDQELNLHYVNNKANRHGNFSAIMQHNGTNLSEELIKNGLAFVYFIDQTSDTKPLFVAEEKARKSKAGMWHDSNFLILNTTDLTIDYSNNLNHFVIIEGVVNNLYISKKNTYLNFGTDWHTDFTIQLENKILKIFPNFIPEKLKGKKLRVRGWLENYNGPFMKIFNPSNVEIIN